MGRLQIVNGSITTYLVDANTPYVKVITESKDNGTQIEYTYGNDLISNGEHYFLTDALGSTRGLIDQTEQLTDTHNYTLYGELSNNTGTAENNFLYTGEQFDSETEDYFLSATYYNPNSAMFLSSYLGSFHVSPFLLSHLNYMLDNIWCFFTAICK
ncbi:MAG: Unknown protein [uncultured Sulfurovum sp.]|uniref:Uncharacterized protein n=1 Tax=uncultured Sulfurovum sp. TaxID=269237 RepID=A0A6S6TT26_9BACT|nr:MAG: Unknown protein [uncultured Sulfurovum sp.]